MRPRSVRTLAFLFLQDPTAAAAAEQVAALEEWVELLRSRDQADAAAAEAQVGAFWGVGPRNGWGRALPQARRRRPSQGVHAF